MASSYRAPVLRNSALTLSVQRQSHFGSKLKVPFSESLTILGQVGGGGPFWLNANFATPGDHCCYKDGCKCWNQMPQTWSYQSLHCWHDYL